MTKFQKSLIAAALSLAASGAQAVTFGSGSNSIFYNNLENQYRSTAACVVGGCLGAGTGPSGWEMVDPTIAGNVAVGDVFAGVINVQNNNYAGGSWLAGATDQFTGYFAQQVTAVGPVGTAARIDLGNVTADPFGILAAGEMIRLYVQTGGGTTLFTDFTAGSTGAVGSPSRVADVIAMATDGSLWASLGVAGAAPDNYAYSIDDLTSPGASQQTAVESFVALTVITTGPAYNIGALDMINDPNEAITGGSKMTPGIVCNGAEAVANVIGCAMYVATSEIEKNTHNWLDGDSFSPFYYASNDPAMVSVSEPAALALVGLGLIGLAGLRRRVG